MTNMYTLCFFFPMTFPIHYFYCDSLKIIKSQIFTEYDTPNVVHDLIKIIDLIGSNCITNEETISVI